MTRSVWYIWSWLFYFLRIAYILLDTLRPIGSGEAKYREQFLGPKAYKESEQAFCLFIVLFVVQLVIGVAILAVTGNISLLLISSCFTLLKAIIYNKYYWPTDETLLKFKTYAEYIETKYKHQKIDNLSSYSLFN